MAIKLKLPQWHSFSAQERQILVDLPCNTEAEIQHYRDRLKQLVHDRTDEPATELTIDPDPEWKNLAVIFEEVFMAIALLICYNGTSHTSPTYGSKSESRTASSRPH